MTTVEAEWISRKPASSRDVSLLCNTCENQPWVEAYGLAVLGVDQNLRAARIQEAKKAMRTRIEVLTDSQEEQHELTALNDALVILSAWEKDAA